MGNLRPTQWSSWLKGGVLLKDHFQGRELSIRYDAGSSSALIYDEHGALMPTVTAFWFAWYAFHPEGEVYVAE